MRGYLQLDRSHEESPARLLSLSIPSHYLHWQTVYEGGIGAGASVPDPAFIPGGGGRNSGRYVCSCMSRCIAASIRDRLVRTTTTAITRDVVSRQLRGQTRENLPDIKTDRYPGVLFDRF